MKRASGARLIFIIFTLFLLIVSFGYQTAFAVPPTLYFGAMPKSIEEGSRFAVKVLVSAVDEPINAVSAVLSYPTDLLRVASISRNGSIINIWTEDPRAQRDKVPFEGVILNPGFQSNAGMVLEVTFEAKKTGKAEFYFSEGAVLANDGQGTNLLATLSRASINILPPLPVFQVQHIADKPKPEPEVEYVLPEKTKVALPVITEYSPLVESKDKIALKGRGEPGAVTKIVFQDVTAKSLGERFVAMLQGKRTKLDEVLVNNDDLGSFEYVSPTNLVAGVYNATPFYVDSDANVEKPGFGVQLLVSDSKIVKYLVIAINVLALMIPVVGLVVIVYFIPWYSWRRMRVIKKKLILEEERLDSSGHQIQRQDKILDKTADQIIPEENKTVYPNQQATDGGENGIIIPK